MARRGHFNPVAGDPDVQNRRPGPSGEPRLKRKSIVALAVSATIIIVFSGLMVFNYRIELELDLSVDLTNIENYTLILPALDGWANMPDHVQMTSGSPSVKKGSIDGKAALTVAGRSDTTLRIAQTMFLTGIGDFSFPVEWNGTKEVGKIFSDFQPTNGTVTLRAAYSVMGKTAVQPVGVSSGGTEYRLQGALEGSWQYLRVDTVIVG